MSFPRPRESISGQQRRRVGKMDSRVRGNDGEESVDRLARRRRYPSGKFDWQAWARPGEPASGAGAEKPAGWPDQARPRRPGGGRPAESNTRCHSRDRGNPSPGGRGGASVKMDSRVRGNDGEGVDRLVPRGPYPSGKVDWQARVLSLGSARGASKRRQEPRSRLDGRIKPGHDDRAVVAEQSPISRCHSRDRAESISRRQRRRVGKDGFPRSRELTGEVWRG